MAISLENYSSLIAFSMTPLMKNHLAGSDCETNRLNTLNTLRAMVGGANEENVRRIKL